MRNRPPRPQKPDQRARIWPAVRRAAAREGAITPALVAGLIKGARVSRPTVVAYLRALTAAGILAPVPGRPGAWVMARNPGPEVPRVTRTGAPNRAAARREALWRTMLILSRGFSLLDLSVHASTDDLTVGPGVTEEYCRALAACGFLAASRRGGRLWYVPLSSRRTGPQPPVPLPDGRVRDDNTGRVYAPAAPESNP